MSHLVGSAVMPFQHQDPAGAGYLTTLVDDIARIFCLQCGDAWAGATSDDSPVRRAWTRSPVDGDFDPRELPGLFLWVSGEPGNDKFSDHIQLTTAELTLMWVPAPVPDHAGHNRADFWDALNAALNMAINVPWWSVDNTTEAWGQNLKSKAGLWELKLGPGRATEIQIHAGDSVEQYMGYQWSLMATKAIVPDGLVSTPTSPAAQTTEFTTSPSDGEPVFVVAETQYPRP